MGVYSELAAQRVNEATMLENFQFSDLLEYAINIDRGNQAMFDAMLEMDFHEAYAEKGLISINEGEEKTGIKAAVDKIIAKIKELWEKFISLATTFMAKFRNVLAQFTGRNKALLDQGKKINLLDRFAEVREALPDNTEVKIFSAGKNEKTGADNGISDIFAPDTEALKRLVDTENVNVERGQNRIDSIFGLDKSIDDYFESVDLKGKLAQRNFLQNIHDHLIYASTFGKGVENNIGGLITYAKDEIKKLSKENKGKDVSTTTRADNANRLSVCSAIVKAAIKYMNFYKSVVARSLMYDRAVYAKCLAVLKKNDKSAKHEATDMNFTFDAIDFMNESVIEEMFD